MDKLNYLLKSYLIIIINNNNKSNKVKIKFKFKIPSQNKLDKNVDI
jgi:hypothetical protein